ncbi:MAG: hypothetical protein KatS3mg129_2731 [Leptospiraceae bacterium]|nr:MAG: hypothetical protein KatS3mg129_2731 [Leptospiraceae bacterium]
MLLFLYHNTEQKQYYNEKIIEYDLKFDQKEKISYYKQIYPYF